MEVLIEQLNGGYLVRHTPRMFKKSKYLAKTLEEALQIAGQAFGMDRCQKVTVTMEYNGLCDGKGGD